jgi:hypothetical protein
MSHMAHVEGRTAYNIIHYPQLKFLLAGYKMLMDLGYPESRIHSYTSTTHHA